MLTFVQKVNDKAVIEELAEWSGLRITKAVLKRLIKNNPEVLTSLSADGIDSTSGREMLMDSMAEELGLGNWPTYADGEKGFAKFEKALFKKAKTKPGYRVDRG